MLNSVMEDIRFSLRMFRKNPGFAAVAVLTLALGIGANTTVFTLVNAVLFADLPVENPDQVVILWSTDLAKGRERMGVSLSDLEDFRAHAKSFKGLTAFGFLDVTVSDPGRPVEVFPGGRMGANTFSVLGQKPLLGRDFLPGEDAPTAPTVAILGYNLWQSRYSGDPGIVGKTIRINEDPKTIVGVMPRGVKFPFNQELWYPFRPNPPAAFRPRDARGLLVFGRLANAVHIADAQSEMNLLARRLELEYPTTNQGIGVRIEPYVDALTRFMGNEIRLIFLAMLGAAGFVLFIACGNVANLLLSRSVRRTREIALRSALGANRSRIVRQLLVESVLLAALGGVVGLLFAFWGTKLFVSAIPAERPIPYWIDFSLDLEVLAYLAAIVVGTTVLFGLAPALHLSKTDLTSMLKEGGRSSAGRSSGLFSKGLVAGQLALALVLLVGAGLMVRSYLKQSAMSSDLESANVLTLQVSLLGPKYTRPEPIADILNRLQSELPNVPGAEAVAMASSLPIGFAFQWRFELEGQPVADPERRPSLAALMITPEYFRVLGVNLLRGRGFTDQDGAPGHPVAIVNQRFANKYWPGEDPLGKRLRLMRELPPMFGEWEDPWMTVVGMAPDIRQNQPSEPEISPLMYVPYRQEPPFGAITVLARSRADAHTLIQPLREMVERVNAEASIRNVLTLPEYFSRTRWQVGFFTSVFAIFASIGLLLALIGTYAVMAYSVSQRTQEIGIRMALGAQKRSILTLVVGRGLRLALVGIAGGLAGSFAITRVMSSLLIGVTATDMTTFALMALLLTMVALLACYIPARRATRVDPIRALRAE